MQNTSRSNQEEFIKSEVNSQHGMENANIQTVKEEPTKSRRPQERLEKVKEVKKVDKFIPNELQQSDLPSPEESSDEGWQEAASKGRSVQTRRKRPNLAKLLVDSSENTGYSSYRRKNMPQAHRGNIVEPKSTSSESSSSPGKALSQAKTSESLIKSDQSTKASSSSRVATIASKLVSYKEVAVSPPGTVLKPVLEKEEEREAKNDETKDAEAKNDETKDEEAKNDETKNEAAENEEANNETQEVINQFNISEDENKVEKTKFEMELPIDDAEKEMNSSPVEEATSEEKSPKSDDNKNSLEPKKDTTSGSKLSASAPPFNPGSLLSMSHPYNTVAIYDMKVVHQAFPNATMEIPSPHSINTRVTRGPRSNLHYRAGSSFRRKPGFSNSQSAVARSSLSSSVMNPHAAEFVPGKALQQIKKDLDAQNPENYIEEGTSDEVLKEEIKKAEKVSEGGKSKETRGKDNTQNEQKTELARQILLSFIVKSSRNSLSSSVETQEIKEPNAAESMQSGEQSSNMVNNDSGLEQLRKAEIRKGEKDTEGFTVVSKRRRSKQNFMNAVNGLYTQQSICTTVG